MPNTQNTPHHMYANDNHLYVHSGFCRECRLLAEPDSDSYRLAKEALTDFVQARSNPKYPRVVALEDLYQSVGQGFAHIAHMRNTIEKYASDLSGRIGTKLDIYDIDSNTVYRFATV